MPKGIKGDTLRNLRIITPTASDTIYAFSAVTIDPVTGEATVGNAGYDSQADDIANERQIVVFDYYIYDKLRNPIPITIYLGDYNTIRDIRVEEDGTLIVEYTHDDNDSFDKAIKWIDSITLDAETGHFTVKYNNGDDDYEQDLDWVKDIVLDDDGTLNIFHTIATSNTVEPNKIKWVNNVELNPISGQFTMTFNDGNKLERQLDWIRDIEIDEETGEIILVHTNSDIGKVTLDAKLKLITKAEASADGVVTFSTNTGESFNIKNKGQETDFHIQTVENIDINQGILEDKRVQIKYNTKTMAEFIGAPINFIQDIIVRPTDYHLLVLFNDPTHRATYTDLVNPDDNGDGKDANGIQWYHNITDSTGIVYDTSVYWRDYGTIKDQSGILIGLSVTDEDLIAAGFQSGQILDYLNATYPLGLEVSQGGINIKGKVVTYSHANGDKQDFYAFDYNKYGNSPADGWYYLGEIADNDKRDAALNKVGQITENIESLKNLTNKGLMFFEKQFKVSDTGIPKYWDVSYVRS